MFYNKVLAVNFTELHELSTVSSDLNETEIALYAWIVDGGGSNGLAFTGSACYSGTGERSKTSMSRGPSRYNAIIETAEVYLITFFAIHIFKFHSFTKNQSNIISYSLL